MSKGKVVVISIFSFLIVLSIILFSFVFCVRKQTVCFVAESTITEQEILTAADIKSGKPIFMINKEDAVTNIESKYANIKVIQIKTTSITSIEIIVRNRYELFYDSNQNNYYILDEELKILRIASEEPTNLIKIDTDLNVKDKTNVADFLGTENQQHISSNLFVAMYSAVLSSEDNQARVDMCNLIKSVNIKEDKLTITTRENVNIEIAKPYTELINKINICFSAIEELTPEQKEKATIKIIYNAKTAEYKGYIDFAE